MLHDLPKKGKSYQLQLIAIILNIHPRLYSRQIYFPNQQYSKRYFNNIFVIA